MRRKLIVIAGPTAVGKTDYSIEVALKYGSPVISCDSRQIYKEMTIGTAVPDASQLAAVKHYFIHSISIHEPYSSGQYEIDALALINKLFDEGHETLVMAGGSGFYVNAVCNGLDALPVPPPELRESLTRRVREEGVNALAQELRRLDPKSWEAIDINNGQRVVRALETFLVSGRSFTEFKLEQPKKRDFDIEKICLTRPRDVLYDRIGRRVLKEIFDHLDGNISMDESIRLIQRNTRHYAKKQLTWWKRDPDVRWIDL